MFSLRVSSASFVTAALTPVLCETVVTERRIPVVAVIVRLFANSRVTAAISASVAFLLFRLSVLIVKLLPVASISSAKSI